MIGNEEEKEEFICDECGKQTENECCLSRCGHFCDDCFSGGHFDLNGDWRCGMCSQGHWVKQKTGDFQMSNQ